MACWVQQQAEPLTYDAMCHALCLSGGGTSRSDCRGPGHSSLRPSASPLHQQSCTCRLQERRREGLLGLGTCKGGCAGCHKDRCNAAGMPPGSRCKIPARYLPARLQCLVCSAPFVPPCGQQALVAALPTTSSWLAERRMGAWLAGATGQSAPHGQRVLQTGFNTALEQDGD